jgi:hypothetical protein
VSPNPCTVDCGLRAFRNDVAPVYDMCEVPRQLTPRTGDGQLSKCKSYLLRSSKLTAVSAACSSWRGFKRDSVKDQKRQAVGTLVAGPPSPTATTVPPSR